jgi:hypothetical protein
MREWEVQDCFLYMDMDMDCHTCRFPSHAFPVICLATCRKGRGVSNDVGVGGAHNLNPRPSTSLSQMEKSQLARLLFTHPNEFRSLLQYWLWHEPKRDITALSEHETSGYNRKTMKRCWEFLDQTSRSFAAVIKELDGDLARVVR